MDKVYNFIIDVLLINSNNSSEKKELYVYSLKILFHAAIHALLTLFIGVLLNALFESVFLIVSFASVRKFSGGVHLEKYKTCLLLSTLIVFFLVLAIKNYSNLFIEKIYLICSFASITVIFFLSPVESTNKTINFKELKIYKITATIASILLLFISVVIIRIKASIGFACGLGINLAAVLLIIEKIKKVIRRRKHS